MVEPFPGSRNIRGCIGSIVDQKGNLWMGCIEGTIVIDLKKRDRAAQGGFSYRQMGEILNIPYRTAQSRVNLAIKTLREKGKI